MIPGTARGGRAETVGRVEGKIKADGTTLGHRAKISWSAHWLRDGARHRPEARRSAALLRNLNARAGFRGTMAVLLCFCIDRLHRCR